MILVDTSIWVDHMAKPPPIMSGLLLKENVLMHPFVLGEVAMGHIHKRNLVLGTLSVFETARIAREEEVLDFLSTHKLYGRGIGYIDVHLLTSVKLTPGTLLWTRDKRLLAAASGLGIAYRPLLN
jgi:predicted nucleic acid-binding protein